MNHTPRPWTALVDGAQSKCRWWIQGPAINSDGFRNIANIATWGTDEMQAANARLIAAAPEMLAFINACLDCKSADELHDFVLNNAEGVISKAEGGTP